LGDAVDDVDLLTEGAESGDADLLDAGGLAATGFELHPEDDAAGKEADAVGEADETGIRVLQ